MRKHDHIFVSSRLGGEDSRCERYGRERHKSLGAQAFLRHQDRSADFLDNWSRHDSIGIDPSSLTRTGITVGRSLYAVDLESVIWREGGA